MTARQQRISRGPLPNAADDPVAAGREAWGRLKNAAGKAWADWVAVGEALLVGRQEAMVAAGTNKPSGKKYNVAFHHWIHDHDFGDIDKADRAKLLLIMTNLPEVEAFRARWSEAERLKRNCPYTVWQAWRCPRRGGSFRAEREQQAKAAPDRSVVATAVTGVEAERADGFDEEKEELAWQRGLFFRAHKSAADAELKSLWALPEPPSEETIAEVRKARDAWATTLRYVESLPGTTAEERAEARRSHAAALASQAARAEAQAAKAQAKKLNGQGEHLERERLDE
jgi:hypothetical protein